MTGPGPGRSAHEQALYQQIHDTATGVLKNKLGITNQTDLELAERYLGAKRAAQGLPEQATRFDRPGLLAIHKHLFQDVYDWAGEIRSYTTGRGPTPFAPPEQIAPWLDRQFAALGRENGLKGLPPDRFALRAAHYVNEINAAHPFVEGNGRVQRTWLRGLAVEAGHRIDLRSSDKERWYAASRIGFKQVDPAPMADLIHEAIRRGQSKEHQPDPLQRPERMFKVRVGQTKDRSR